MKFYYYKIKETDRILIKEITAKTILIADIAFKHLTGIDPQEDKNIVVTLVKRKLKT